MGDGIMLHRVMSAAPRFTFVPTNPNAAPGFTYVNDGHGNWRIKFLTSGTLTFQSTLSHGIDVFLVGGGAGGVAYVGTMVATAGGGAGYTKTQKGVAVTRETAYPITIGAGGAGKGASGSGSGSATGNNGGNTSAFGYTASGGKGGQAGHAYYPETYNYNWAQGGNGGSGGAPDVGGGGTGGTDGGNSQELWSHTTSGKGQKSVAGPNGETGTTREFGEPDGTMYAQGGGTSTTETANTGNGGRQGNNNGSSGIVVIRNHRE